MEHSECLCKLVAYNASLLVKHWQADTVTNAHKALGSLYETMTELTDDLAEVCMGKYGVIDECSGSLTSLKDPPAEGLEIVEELQNEFSAGADDDVLNILADMSAALNKTAYLLKTGTTSAEESGSDIEEFTDEDMPS